MKPFRPAGRWALNTPLCPLCGLLMFDSPSAQGIGLGKAGEAGCLGRGQALCWTLHTRLNKHV